MDAHVGESYAPRPQPGVDRTSGLLDGAAEGRSRRPKSSRDQPETAYGVILLRTFITPTSSSLTIVHLQ